MMRITPIDIQQYQFKSRPFGYEKAGVDRFLESVADELERLHKQSQELKEELARNGAVLEEMRQREQLLKETLLTTQRVTEELKANARREAELAVAEAKMQGERIVREAEERRIRMMDEMQELKRQRVSFETSLRALVEGHVRLLDLGVVTLDGDSRDDLLLAKPLATGDEEESSGAKAS